MQLKYIHCSASTCWLSVYFLSYHVDLKGDGRQLESCAVQSVRIWDFLIFGFFSVAENLVQFHQHWTEQRKKVYQSIKTLFQSRTDHGPNEHTTLNKKSAHTHTKLKWI